MDNLLNLIRNSHDLDDEQARKLADGFFDGALDETGMNAALLALNAKGVTVDELVGFARSMKSHAVPIQPKAAVIDTCGTGGDGQRTFNISTAAAILVSSCGVPVAKHGNKSQSSATGSADVLQALGVPIDLPPEQTADRIDQQGFGFLYAPQYHPAMKRVAPVRKALGVKTIFNMLGPLTNPANPSAQVIGAYSLDAQNIMAAACARLDVKRAIVVHAEGHDEAGLKRTRIVEIRHGQLVESFLEPTDFEIFAEASDLVVSDAAQSAEKVRRALKHAQSPESQVVRLNAALALRVAGKVSSVEQGLQKAQDAVESGIATAKLAEIEEAARA